MARAETVAAAHNAANVRGKHVLGVLPHHLSAQAASITEVQLDWTVEQRAAMQRGDLGVEDVANAVRGLHTYFVQRYDAETALPIALANAIRHTSAYDARVLLRVDSGPGGQVIRIDEVSQQMSADVHVDMVTGSTWVPNPRHSDTGDRRTAIER
jgi:hypothetical protein